MKKPLIILTGPTAVGKTELSIDLAAAIGGEIISADSMQVYRHMDIGSAKVTKEEMKGIPHYLIDEISPFEEFHVVRFQQMAKMALKEIYNRGKIPIIAGGTGFYIQALLYDIDFTENEREDVLRNELYEAAKLHGAEYLHDRLKEVDPEAAEKIHPNNIKRVIRAIEFYKLTGKKISQHNEEEGKKESPFRYLYFVLNTERPVLYDRINRRVDGMMEAGLVEEVRKLWKMGCRAEMVSMKGLGYKEILGYLEGKTTLSEAVDILKRDTRRFAKRQLTWFQREKEVQWVYLPDFENDKEKILSFLLKEIENAGLTGRKTKENG